ncbi:hypothetical protein [uncultured Bacteroides sp.]|uniref:hypothetical protein n=1 Tax=uncultured Bacteroides sp. TaxID=162156 RepID=UPI002AABD87D|nr:hypothetical protein [uncultured Bacteroides sp.]
MTKQELVLESLIYIEWNLLGGISVKKTSEAMNCSLQYLGKAFYELLGMRLARYIHLRVLSEARKKVTATYSLKEVAKCFEMSPEKLIYSFQKEFGYSIFSDRDIAFPLPLGKDLIKILLVRFKDI